MMPYMPYQPPYGGYNYQQTYMPYTAPRFDAAQAPQNTAGVASMSPAMSAPSAPQPGFLCRPVTSKEEALGVQVDYLSAGTIMPDLGHGMMYLKRFDSNTGLSNMFEFSLVQPQENTASQTVSEGPGYEEAMRTLSEKLESVSDRIDVISEKLETWKPKTNAKKGGSDE